LPLAIYLWRILKMRIFKTQKEFDKEVVNEVFKVNDDVRFEFDLDTDANIDALDIDALDIDANNIYAEDIYARNIETYNIDADNISYYAVCFAFNDIICNSIKGRRENARHFCLDGKIIIRES
jgi:hypothetical protein